MVGEKRIGVSIARDNLWQSRVQQALQYNKRRVQGQELIEGDWVLVEAGDRKGTPGVAKLREWFQGPYKIKKVLNGVRNFKLLLDTGDSSHNTFHVSKLNKY